MYVFHGPLCRVVSLSRTPGIGNGGHVVGTFYKGGERIAKVTGRRWRSAKRLQGVCGGGKATEEGKKGTWCIDSTQGKGVDSSLSPHSASRSRRTNLVHRDPGRAGSASYASSARKSRTRVDGIPATASPRHARQSRK